jgi:hypothetical protein
MSTGHISAAFDASPAMAHAGAAQQQHRSVLHYTPASANLELLRQEAELQRQMSSNPLFSSSTGQTDGSPGPKPQQLQVQLPEQQETAAEAEEAAEEDMTEALLLWDQASSTHEGTGSRPGSVSPAPSSPFRIPAIDFYIRFGSTSLHQQPPDAATESGSCSSFPSTPREALTSRGSAAGPEEDEQGEAAARDQGSKTDNDSDAEADELLRQQEEALREAAQKLGIELLARPHPRLPQPQAQAAAAPLEQPFPLAWSMLKFAMVSSQAGGKPDRLGDGPYWAAAMLSSMLGQEQYCGLLDVSQQVLQRAQYDALAPGAAQQPQSKRLQAFVAEAQKAATTTKLVQVRLLRVALLAEHAHGMPQCLVAAAVQSPGAAAWFLSRGV